MASPLEQLNPLKDNRGFALALILALLPALVAALLAVFAILSFIQADLKMKYVCRSEGLRGQQQVAPLLAELLALNPEAVKLQMSLIQARAQAASGNPAALARLAQVELAVRSFRLKQEQFIRMSNFILWQHHMSMKEQLLTEGRFLKRAIPLLDGDFNLHFAGTPKLAVRPSFPEDPPTYTPVFDFSEKQALVQSWQFRLFIIKPLQIFLDGNFRFEKSCAVTLRSENMQWLPQIIDKKDKSSSSWL